jgi:hypothetical protein
MHLVFHSSTSFTVQSGDNINGRSQRLIFCCQWLIEQRLALAIGLVTSRKVVAGSQSLAASVRHLMTLEEQWAFQCWGRWATLLHHAVCKLVAIVPVGYSTQLWWLHTALGHACSSPRSCKSHRDLHLNEYCMNACSNSTRAIDTNR